jgi:hypothetical protein
VAELALLELADGSEVVTTSWSPAFRPLTICVRLSPLSPTTTCCDTVLPPRSSDTVASDPLPLTASFGMVTPCAWPVITEAEALIPGLTRESFWSSVRVAS